MISGVGDGQNIRDVVINLLLRADPSNEATAKKVGEQVTGAQSGRGGGAGGGGKKTTTDYLNEEEKARAKYHLAAMQRQKQYAAQVERDEREQMRRGAQMAKEEDRRLAAKARAEKKAADDQMRYGRDLARQYDRNIAARLKAEKAAANEQLRYGAQLARQMDQQIAAQQRDNQIGGQMAWSGGLQAAKGIAELAALHQARGVDGLKPGQADISGLLQGLVGIQGAFDIASGTGLMRGLRRTNLGRSVGGGFMRGAGWLASGIGATGVGGSALGVGAAGLGAIAGGGAGIYAGWDMGRNIKRNGFMGGATPGSYSDVVSRGEVGAFDTAAGWLGFDPFNTRATARKQRLQLRKQEQAIDAEDRRYQLDEDASLGYQNRSAERMSALAGALQSIEGHRAFTGTMLRAGQARRTSMGFLDEREAMNYSGDPNSALSIATGRLGAEDRFNTIDTGSRLDTNDTQRRANALMLGRAQAMNSGNEALGSGKSLTLAKTLQEEILALQKQGKALEVESANIKVDGAEKALAIRTQEKQLLLSAAHSAGQENFASASGFGGKNILEQNDLIRLGKRVNTEGIDSLTQAERQRYATLHPEAARNVQKSFEQAAMANPDYQAALPAGALGKPAELMNKANAINVDAQANITIELQAGRQQTIDKVTAEIKKLFDKQNKEMEEAFARERARQDRKDALGRAQRAAAMLP